MPELLNVGIGQLRPAHDPPRPPPSKAGFKLDPDLEQQQRSRLWWILGPLGMMHWGTKDVELKAIQIARDAKKKIDVNVAVATRKVVVSTGAIAILAMWFFSKDR